MSPIRAAVIAAALLLSSTAGGARAAAPSPDPSALRSMAERAELLLADVLGPGRARVFVRARSGAQPPAELPQPGALFDRVQRGLEDAPPVLPGFALPRTLKDELLRAYAAAPPAPPETLEATLVLDRGVPQENVQRALDLTERVLGLDPEDGDVLRIVREDIAPKSPPLPPPPARPWSGLPDNVFAGLQALLATAVLLVAALAALRMIVPLPGVSRPRAGRAALLRRLKDSAALARLLPDPAGAGLPRLKPGEAAAAAEFLSAETPAAAAAALKAFGARTAAAVLRRMDARARASAAFELARPRPPLAPAPARARRWPWSKAAPPEPLGRRLARRLSEEERALFLDELFLYLDAGGRAELLEAVERSSPARARELRRLPTLDALAATDPASLRLLLCRFPLGDIAGALAAADEETRGRLLAALPPPVAAAVRDEPVPADPDGERARALHGELLARWRRLALEGRMPPAVLP